LSALIHFLIFELLKSFYFSEEEIYECPDYRTSGPNSCYFNKNHTSPWTTFNITVTATNEIGSNSSDPQYVDVTSIGKKGRMKCKRKKKST